MTSWSEATQAAVKNMSDKPYQDHVIRLENLKVAVCNLQSAVFEHGIHHVDAKVRYDQMIAALNRINDRGNVS